MDKVRQILARPMRAIGLVRLQCEYNSDSMLQDLVDDAMTPEPGEMDACSGRSGRRRVGLQNVGYSPKRLATTSRDSRVRALRAER